MMNREANQVEETAATTGKQDKIGSKSAIPKSSTNKGEELLPLDFIPNSDYDVIFGRGKECYNSNGNRRFRDIVRNHIPKYSAATTKWEKTTIVSDIIGLVKDVNNGAASGRFVRFCDQKARWYQVGNAAVREKVSSTFRDFLPRKYSSATRVKNARRLSRNKQERQLKLLASAAAAEMASTTGNPARTVQTAAAPGSSYAALAPTADAAARFRLLDQRRRQAAAASAVAAAAAGAPELVGSGTAEGKMDSEAEGGVDRPESRASQALEKKLPPAKKSPASSAALSAAVPHGYDVLAQAARLAQPLSTAAAAPAVAAASTLSPSTAALLRAEQAILEARAAQLAERHELVRKSLAEHQHQQEMAVARQRIVLAAAAAAAVEGRSPQQQQAAALAAAAATGGSTAYPSLVAAAAAQHGLVAPSAAGIRPPIAVSTRSTAAAAIEQAAGTLGLPASAAVSVGLGATPSAPDAAAARQAVSSSQPTQATSGGLAALPPHAAASLPQISGAPGSEPSYIVLGTVVPNFALALAPYCQHQAAAASAGLSLLASAQQLQQQLPDTSGKGQEEY